MEHEKNKGENNRDFSYRYNKLLNMDFLTISRNSKNIVDDLDWLGRILDARLSKLQKKTATELAFHDEAPPRTIYKDKLAKHDFTGGNIINDFKIFLFIGFLPGR